MLRAMFSGVSGLRSHQTMLDVVSNNIANVNTSGFKASRVTFQEAISQVLRGSSGTDVVRAGTNPMQLGLGTNVASIDGIFTQGATQLTGRNTDLAIQGDGFFIVEAGGARQYTRSGAFSLDQGGNMVGPTGAVAQGWMADATGEVNFNSEVTSIQLPAGQTIPPVATTVVEVGGNLPVEDVPGVTRISSSITMYDSLGDPQRLTMHFDSTGVNTWDVSAEYTDAAGTVLTAPAAPVEVIFDTDGAMLSVGGVAVGPGAPAEIALTGLNFGNGSSLQDLTIKLDGAVETVQFGGGRTLEAREQDGQPIGLLRGFAVGNDGAITGQFSNGEAKVLGYMAMATFNNPAGLVREGESMYSESGNSGVELVGPPGTGSAGLITAGALEMANVDLAQEFTNLIIAQRGFQANSRAITTSDEVLSELVNLKR